MKIRSIILFLFFQFFMTFKADAVIELLMFGFAQCCAPCLKECANICHDCCESCNKCCKEMIECCCGVTSNTSNQLNMLPDTVGDYRRLSFDDRRMSVDMEDFANRRKSFGSPIRIKPENEGF